VPLVFADEAQWSVAAVGQRWRIPGLRQAVVSGAETVAADIDDAERLQLRLELSPREREVLAAGGLLAYVSTGGRRQVTVPGAEPGTRQEPRAKPRERIHATRKPRRPRGPDL
jgi:hypothetical protein